MNAATLTAKAVMDASGFLSPTQQMTRSLRGLQQWTGLAGISTAGLTQAFTIGGAAGVGFAGAMTAVRTGLSAVTSLASVAVDSLSWGGQLAAEQEQAQVAFTTMLHSGEKATEMLKGLEKFATATPFDFPQVRDAAKSLLGMGIAAKDVQPSLKTIGEIASGVGVPIGQLAMVFGQVKTAGRLMTQDMNQFTSAGVALPRALAKELGIAENQVRSFVEKGKVNFTTFQNALIRLSETDFAGGMEKQSRTALGAMSTLQDAAGGLFKDLAAGIGEQFKVTEWINDLAGFLGYVREQWGPGLINIFTSLVSTLDKIMTPFRIGIADMMRNMATMATFAGTSLQGTVSEDFGKELLNGAGMLNMGANALSSKTFSQRAEDLQKFFKDNAITNEAGEGLKRQPFGDLIGKASSGIGSSLKNAFANVGQTLGGMGMSGLRNLTRSVLEPRKREEVGPTGALVAGSSEAFSAMIRAMTGRDKPAERTAKASEEAVKRLDAAVGWLRKIAEDTTGDVVASFASSG